MALYEKYAKQEKIYVRSRIIVESANFTTGTNIIHIENYV